MRMLIIIIGLAVFLNSCTSSGTVTPQSVVDEIKKDCGIITTVADIAALITSQPTLITVAAFANEVCSAFKAQPATPTASGAGGMFLVNNVPIHYTLP